MENDEKRVFFGLEVTAPWPQGLPHGRMLDENHRHITLAFLGKTRLPKLLETLTEFPRPDFRVGLAGKFDRCLFLPERHPNVVAWHVAWDDDSTKLLDFQKKFVNWLLNKDFPPAQPDREWLPHVTLCRRPFHAGQWAKSFVELPVVCKDIHLYESVGNLTYKPVWSCPLIPPFEEIEHTADIAFNVNGDTIEQIQHHAQTALAFKFPQLLEYLGNGAEKQTIEDIVIHLNDIIAKADQDCGCPFKAVSFHGDITLINNKYLQWEMIIDV